MSFITVPAVVNSGAPGVSDDVTKGFAVGDLWVDSSVSPRVAYTCTNNSTGAATWTSGGVSALRSFCQLVGQRDDTFIELIKRHMFGVRPGVQMNTMANVSG